MNQTPRKPERHPVIAALEEFYDPVFRQPFLWCGLALQACLLTTFHPAATGWTKVILAVLTGAAAITAAQRWTLQLRNAGRPSPRKPRTP